MMNSDKQIRTYFEPYKNETCLTLGFIFRTLGANHEFYRTNLEHTAFLAPAQYILDVPFYLVSQLSSY